jgi:hypothetical protein
MERTLVVILAETRASDLTFETIKTNVIDTLQADLCVCIGVKADYNYEDPFYKLAKYRFLYDEEKDNTFAESVPYSYNNTVCSNTYERLENINFLYGKIPHPRYSDDNYKYLGDFDSADEIDLTTFFDYDSFVYHKPELNNAYSKQLYAILCNNDNWKSEKDVITFTKKKHYTDFLKIKHKIACDTGNLNTFSNFQISTYLHIFFLWFLQKNLVEHNLVSQYDRFIIMRSDYIFKLPFPSLQLLDKEKIWLPDGEDYSGVCDRFVLLSKDKLIPYISIMDNFYTQSNKYCKNIENEDCWNMERILAMHLKEQKILNSIRRIPYVMYSIRGINGTTRWQEGVFNKELGYYIKYPNEYSMAVAHKHNFDKSGLTMDAFYKSILH